VLLAAPPAADSASQTSSGFTVVASPPLARPGYLTAVAAVSPTDVWAIGQYRGGTRLMEHYDGSAWRVVAPPPLPHGALRSISAHGSAVWVVGACYVASGGYGCAARYTGTNWVRVAIPKQFSSDFVYNAVLVFSNTNVVVGGAFNDKSELIRWNGKTWSRVHDVPYAGQTIGIAGTLSNHLFSAGVSLATSQRVSSHGTFEHERANGSWQLSQAFGPNPSATPIFDSSAAAIFASSADNAWVVGRLWNEPADAWIPVAMRWNGATQTAVTVANQPADGNLAGVFTARPDDTWAVGWAGGATLIAHYTGGASFSQVTSPVANGELLAITAVPGAESDMWAVGLSSAGDAQPIILHHS
jgi:hypothetical protein